MSESARLHSFRRVPVYSPWSYNAFDLKASGRGKQFHSVHTSLSFNPIVSLVTRYYSQDAAELIPSLAPCQLPGAESCHSDRDYHIHDGFLWPIPLSLCDGLYNDQLGRFNCRFNIDYR